MATPKRFMDERFLYSRWCLMKKIVDVLFILVLACAILLLVIRQVDRRITGTSPSISSSIHEVHASSDPGQVMTATGPLFVDPDNSRYFTDGTRVNGKYRAILLAGSHTWCDFMDCGSLNPPPAFNYSAFLDFLQANHHNFFRLWRAENARGGEQGPNFWFRPLPYVRSSQCCAFDGANKFDVSQFNQTYFDRMRQRVMQARDRGMYVSIMLFDGWSVESKIGSHHPWDGHPYKLTNNINQINGDRNNDDEGGEIQILANPQITALEEAYVRKVIDSVNDLDNVLYEISNESDGGAAQTAWQYHIIAYVKNYELTKAKQHPVGMTAEWPDGKNADLYNSPADWIAPNGDVNTPPVANGRKVVLYDTDHLCGICGNRQFVWKSFTRGENPVFMDPYDGAAGGRGAPANYNPNNANDVSLRQNLGYVRSFGDRMDLAGMTPQPALCSTGYCLANPTANGAEYLAYLPSGGSITMNLSAAPVTLSVEWFNPANGSISFGNAVIGGGPQAFAPPFSGDAVLHLKYVNRARLWSKGLYDGWVLESGEFTDVGGTMNSSGTSFNLGDDTFNRQYRAILSFNASLPNNAVITSITLKIQSGKQVGNPFASLGPIAVDIKKGTFGTLSLELGDFQAVASTQGAMQINNHPLAGAWYSCSLGTEANTLISKIGTTQFRLRFSKDDNNNLSADYLQFYSGNAPVADRPALIIRYYVTVP